MKTLQLSTAELSAIIFALGDGIDSAEDYAANLFFMNYCVGASGMRPFMDAALGRIHLCFQVRERLYRL